MVDRYDDLGADTRLVLIQPDLDDVLAVKQRLDDRDSVVMVDTSFKPAPSVAIDDSRLTSAELAIDELTGLCAFKDVELDNRMEVVERKVDELSRVAAARSLNVPKDWSDDVERMVLSHMQKMMGSTLEAAFIPLVEKVSTKLAEFETHLAILGPTPTPPTPP